jgi:hypothetical protein
MVKFKYRVVAALVALAVVLIAASVIILDRKVSSITRIAELEQPPCKSCQGFYQDSEIPSISICEAKSNLERYRGKILRVRAAFHHDAGLINLLDDACPNMRLHAGLSNLFESCIGARKALTIYSGLGTWYDSTAKVVAVGSVGRLENPTLFEDNDGFNILCLEKAEPIGSGKVERRKYAEGELLGLNPH